MKSAITVFVLMTFFITMKAQAFCPNFTGTYETGRLTNLVLIQDDCKTITEFYISTNGGIDTLEGKFIHHVLSDVLKGNTIILSKGSSFNAYTLYHDFISGNTVLIFNYSAFPYLQGNVSGPYIIGKRQKMTNIHP